jgi:hypothetical protein
VQRNNFKLYYLLNKEKIKSSRNACKRKHETTDNEKGNSNVYADLGMADADERYNN